MASLLLLLAKVAGELCLVPASVWWDPFWRAHLGGLVVQITSGHSEGRGWKKTKSAGYHGFGMSPAVTVRPSEYDPPRPILRDPLRMCR